MLVASTSVVGLNCATPGASPSRTPPSRPRVSPRSPVRGGAYSVLAFASVVPPLLPRISTRTLNLTGKSPCAPWPVGRPSSATSPARPDASMLRAAEGGNMPLAY
jgi:hypothetical protein